MTGKDAAIREALAALSSPDHNERFSAIETLARLRYVDGVSRIIESTRDTHIGVREAAVWALGDLGALAATDRLREIVSDRTATHSIRGAALYGLGTLGDLSTLPSIFSVACNESDSELQAAAQRAALRFGESAVSFFVEVLNNQDSAKLYGRTERLTAIALLGKLHSSSALEPLVRMARAHVGELSWASFQAIGEIAHPASIEFLVEQLTEAPETFHRMILWALLNIDTPISRVAAEHWQEAHPNQPYLPADGAPLLPPTQDDLDVPF